MISLFAFLATRHRATVILYRTVYCNLFACWQINVVVVVSVVPVSTCTASLSGHQSPNWFVACWFGTDFVCSLPCRPDFSDRKPRSITTSVHQWCTLHTSTVYSSCLPSAMDMLSSRVPLTLPPGCYQTGCHYTQIRQVLLALLSGSAYSQTVHRWQPSFTSCCSADLYFTTGQHCLGINSTVIL